MSTSNGTLLITKQFEKTSVIRLTFPMKEQSKQYLRDQVKIELTGVLGCSKWTRAKNAQYDNYNKCLWKFDTNRPTIHVVFSDSTWFVCIFFIFSIILFIEIAMGSWWLCAGWASPFVEALIFFYGSSHLPSFYSPSVCCPKCRHQKAEWGGADARRSWTTKGNRGNHHNFGERRQSAKLCPHKAF